MSKEYIDREQLRKRIEHDLTRWEESASMYTEDKSGMVAMREALRELLIAPAADVAPVVHGKWIIGDDEDTFDVLCTNCGYSECFDVCGIFAVKAIAEEMHYCHNCGAKMDLEVDNE